MITELGSSSSRIWGEEEGSEVGGRGVHNIELYVGRGPRGTWIPPSLALTRGTKSGHSNYDLPTLYTATTLYYLSISSVQLSISLQGPRTVQGTTRKWSVQLGAKARQDTRKANSSDPARKQTNLTLYSITALLILDADGHRVLAKYYHPPHSAPTSGQNSATPSSSTGPQGLASLKEQKAFEKSVHEKTKRGGGMSRRISTRKLLVTCMA